MPSRLQRPGAGWNPEASPSTPPQRDCPRTAQPPLHAETRRPRPQEARGDFISCHLGQGGERRCKDLHLQRTRSRAHWHHLEWLSLFLLHLRIWGHLLQFENGPRRRVEGVVTCPGRVTIQGSYSTALPATALTGRVHGPLSLQKRNWWCQPRQMQTAGPQKPWTRSWVVGARNKRFPRGC